MNNENNAREYCESQQSIKTRPVEGLWCLRVQINCLIGGERYRTWRNSWEEAAAVVGVLLDMQERFGIEQIPPSHTCKRMEYLGV